jgi:hypothetical protein
MNIEVIETKQKKTEKVKERERVRKEMVIVCKQGRLLVLTVY